MHKAWWCGTVRGDHDGLDLRVPQKHVEVARRSRAGEQTRHVVELALIEVADVDQLRLGELMIIARQVLAPAAYAYQADTHRIHRYL